MEATINIREPPAQQPYQYTYTWYIRILVEKLYNLRTMYQSIAIVLLEKEVVLYSTFMKNPYL